MADPERAPAPPAAAAEAPSPQAPAAAPADAQHLTVATPVALAHASTPSKWRVPLLATLGAVLGFFIGTGLYSEIQHPGDLLFIAVVTGTATYWFFDPLMELIYGWMGVPPRKIPENRRLYTTLAIVVAILLIAGLHHSLSKALEDQTEGISGFFYVLVVGFLTVGLTTLHWIKGAGTLPPRVAVHGARSGGLAGAGFGVLGLIGLALQHKIPAPPANAIPAAHYAGVLIGGIGLPSIMWLIPGLVGGLAIEKNWDRKSPTRGILIALAALSAVLAITALSISHWAPQYSKTAWLLALQFIPLNIGWGLGPFLQRETCDPAFRGFAPGMAALQTAHGQILPAGTVIPIDSLRGTTVPSQTGPSQNVLSPSETSPDYNQVPPHILLLQPTGSRGWSLVILLLALAAGGVAYATGMARTDPEIVSEIESKFQLDSGLHGKTITVQSADRVVTLGGTVDNGIQHTAAVQEASGVRGVKQLIDQVQVQPPPPPPAPKVIPAKAPPAPTKTTTINAQFNFFKGSKQPGASAANPKAASKTGAPKTAAPTTASTKKPGGFFHFLKHGNNKKTTTTH
jgi:BON domain